MTLISLGRTSLFGSQKYRSSYNCCINSRSSAVDLVFSHSSHNIFSRPRPSVANFLLPQAKNFHKNLHSLLRYKATAHATMPPKGKKGTKKTSPAATDEFSSSTSTSLHPPQTNASVAHPLAHIVTPSTETRGRSPSKGPRANTLTPSPPSPPKL